MSTAQVDTPMDEGEHRHESGPTSLHPKALMSHLETPRSVPDDKKDPIINELMKLTPHENESITTKLVALINQYSFQLQELTKALDYESLDDSVRINLETQLLELTTFIPEIDPKEQEKSQFPNEHLLKIVIDNYKSLLKISSSYFNLSLASHITRYMVSLIYSLQYWEVYHLLYLLPDLEYFLKLCDIEVIQTSFGPLVKPPTNYVEPHMAQGVDYPFPYPFYNYSYHLFDKDSTKRKFEKVSIKSYIDITLKNVEPVRKSQKKLDTQLKLQAQKHQKEELLKSPTNSIQSESTELLLNDKKKQKQEQEKQLEEEQQKEERIKYESQDQPKKLRDLQSQEPKPLQFKQSIPKPVTKSPVPTGDEITTDYSDSDDEKGNSDLSEEMRKQQKASKSGVIHQCHLLDPNSLTPCLKIFYGKNELLRHQEFVHATKKKIYKCVYCLRNGTKVSSYPRHDSLARHIRRKHGITGKENKMAVNYAKENVEIIDDPGKFAQVQAQAQAQARARAQAQANVVAQSQQGRAQSTGDEKSPTLGNSPIEPTMASPSTTSIIVTSSVSEFEVGMQNPSNPQRSPESVVLPSIPGTETVGPSIKNNPLMKSPNLVRPESFIMNPKVSPNQGQQQQIPHQHLQTQEHLHQPPPHQQLPQRHHHQQKLPPLQSILSFPQLGMARSPIPAAQQMYQAQLSPNQQKQIPQQQPQQPQQQPPPPPPIQQQLSPHTQRGIPSQGSGPGQYMNMNPEYNKMGYNGFLNFNLKDVNLTANNRAPPRLSSGAMEPVNFNKPEGSSIKNNFQKFRVSESPNPNNGMIPGIMGDMKLPFMDGGRPRIGLQGIPGINQIPPPNVPTSNVSGVLGRPLQPPPSLSGSSQRLPGISMYLKPEWDQRVGTNGAGGPPPPLGGLPPPSQLSRNTPPQMHQQPGARMNNGQQQFPPFQMHSQFPPMHLPMLRDNQGDMNHGLPPNNR